MVESAQIESRERFARVRVLLCTFYGACIICALLIYGLWQERIMALPYQSPTDYFNISVFLVLINRIFGFFFALIMIFVMGESFKNHAPLWKYALISVSTVVASICQYEALKYVSFTVQVLGKSSKMMPVMCWGTMWFKRKYKLIDWIVALGITIGVIWFMLSGDISPEYRSNGSTWSGIGLLVAFIVLDGFTSTFQENLFAKSWTSKYNQMLYINICSAILSALVLLISGNAPEAFRFCNVHPTVWGDASILSSAAVVAQWFIYSQVQDFGALAFAATMNLRQVTSVLGSYIAYHHSPNSITVLQIIGLIIIFATLALHSIVGCISDAAEKQKLLSQKSGGENFNVIKLKKTTAAQCCLPCCRTV